jgi:prepilin-type N-terminal cleavage/methylation domain-containing protein
MTRSARGFSLMELSVVVAVWAVLFGVFLERLTYYQEAAEHARFESELQTFKTGLQLRMAELISANREHELRELETASPLRWLGKAPATFAGEYPGTPEPGNWYFDSATRELVYVPNLVRFLKTSEPRQPAQLRFRVRIIYQPVHAPGGRVRGVAGIALDSSPSFQWL